MREPTPTGAPAERPATERKRLGLYLLLLPILIAAGALLGSRLGPAAAKLHPTVALAELYLANEKSPANYPLMTPEALSLERAAADPEAVLSAARPIRQRVTLAAWCFGAWAGLVVGLKLLSLCVRVTRSDYEPDRGACVACARCFLSCPNERARLGLPPEPESVPTPAASPEVGKPVKAPVKPTT
jgi:ferredoxin